MKKLTNEIIDKQLENRKIQRLDDYIGSKAISRWLCLEEGCKNIWMTTWNSISSIKSGCAKCAGNLPLTNEEVNEKLKYKNIILLEPFTSTRNKHLLRCNVCLREWSPIIKDVINSGRGCAKCYGNLPLTNEEIFDRFKYKEITLLEPFLTTANKHLLRCNVCLHEWNPILSDVIHKGQGCPVCKKASHGEKLIINILKNVNLQYNYNYSIKKLDPQEIKDYKVDFYLPEFRLAIEYNGEQHYKPVRFSKQTLEQAERKFEKQVIRDRYVEDFYKKIDIELVWIDGRGYKGYKLQKYVEQIIQPLLKQAA